MSPNFLVSRQVYMWVGTQTSQVEIKLSLKACQVSGKLQFYAHTFFFSCVCLRVFKLCVGVAYP